MDASGLIQSLKNNPVALGLSVALHLVLFILLGISLSSSEVPKQKGTKQETVKAFIVDVDVVEQEIKKLKQAELNKKKKIQSETDRLKKQLEKQKKRLAKIRKDQKTLLLKKAEQKKKNEKQTERKRLAAIKKKRDDAIAVKRRVKEQEELRRKMEEEERRSAAHNEKLKSLRDLYVKLIEQKVERNWLRPVTVSSGYKCEVFVTQSVLGDVINVRLGVCANDQIFRNSIERAVRKSSPLPPPPNPEVFDREIRFIFKPKV